MQTVELGVGRVFLYRGAVFETGKVYSVSDDVARELLGKLTHKGAPHFRLAMLEEGDTISSPDSVEDDAPALSNFAEGDVAAVATTEPAEEAPKRRTKAVGRKKSVAL